MCKFSGEEIIDCFYDLCKAEEVYLDVDKLMEVMEFKGSKAEFFSFLSETLQDGEDYILLLGTVEERSSKGTIWDYICSGVLPPDEMADKIDTMSLAKLGNNYEKYKQKKHS